MALVMPITFTGLHALSVDIPTTVPTGRPSSWIERTMFSGPSMLVRTASKGKYSHVGTCFSAAALNTTSTPWSTEATEWKSLTSPILNSRMRRELS